MTRASPPALIGATAALAELHGWQSCATRDAIEKQYVFANFNAAFAFMTRVALYAEKHDHHPEWSNIYNRVSVLLTTHEAAGVTARDLALAAFMDRSAGMF
jgi:4a-hydroxytetrahydrobiopterin dehydratase